MTETQVRSRGVHDERVIQAMSAVPRHDFVEPALANQAYADHPLPIGGGQTVSQPYIVAYMIEALRLGSPARVLEIGTGCGYQTAVLARIAHEVFTIEILPQLAAFAERRFQELGLSNVRTRVSDGHLGWAEESPFDGIIVSAAPSRVPEALVEQLAVGGRLVIPVGEFDQDIMIVTRTVSGVTTERTIAVRFVPMTGGTV